MVPTAVVGGPRTTERNDEQQAESIARPEEEMD
jgi:hypothetical protein